jgi:hypothetical protein
MTSTMDWERKIDALLRKAENPGVTPEEAQLFSDKAAELMVLYGIDRAVIAARRGASNGEAEKIVQHSVNVDGIFSAAWLGMGVDVAYALGSMRLLQTKAEQGSGRTLIVIGFESDVQQFEVLFASLRLQAASALERFWRLHPDRRYLAKMPAFKERRQFLVSFGIGVGQRIARARSVALDEHKGTGAELAVIDRSRSVDTWVDKQYPRLRKSHSRSQGGSLYARTRGHEAGLTADTGDRQVANTQERCS